MLYKYLVILLSLVSYVSAVKFAVEAKPRGAKPRCIRDFVNKGTMVVVKGKISGYNGDGQQMNVFIIDNKGNEYGRKKNVVNSVTIGFTAHDNAAFDVCFENILTGNAAGQYRNVELDVEIGAGARDWNSVQANERLKPVEVEMRKIEEMAEEVQKELEYLKVRETRLRDTNESTNRRVKMFSIIILLSLVSLGVWQIVYLRAYFRAKHII